MAEYGIPFPVVSDDPLEQWLVEEAVMTAWHIEREEKERRDKDREDRKAQAEQLLQQHRAKQGLS